MSFFGSNWLEDNSSSGPIGYSDQEVKIKMISLLMDILKCRKEHAQTLVDNHMKKQLNKSKKGKTYGSL